MISNHGSVTISLPVVLPFPEMLGYTRGVIDLRSKSDSLCYTLTHDASATSHPDHGRLASRVKSGNFIQTIGCAKPTKSSVIMDKRGLVPSD